MTTSYDSVAPLVSQTASEFLRRFGGDPDEARAVARLAYCKARAAAEAGPPRATKFTTHVRWVVWHELLEARRREARRAARLRYGLEGERLPARRHFDPKALAAEVSPDAARVVREALGLVRPQGRGRLRRLLQEAGWTAARIAEAFREVTEVLSS